MTVEDYRATSLWLEGVPGALTPRPAYEGTSEVDVAVIGGGFTGLWTAYYLSQGRPVAAHRRARGRDLRLRRVGPQRGLGVGAVLRVAQVAGRRRRPRGCGGPAAGDERHRRRDRQGGRRRADRLPLQQRRHAQPRPYAGPADPAAGPRQGRAGVGRRRLRVARRHDARARGSAQQAFSARPTLRTARPSSPRCSPAVSPRCSHAATTSRIHEKQPGGLVRAPAGAPRDRYAACHGT